MNELSLFSGVGGGLLGSKILGWKTIGYVEYDDYCQKVITQRIKDGILDNAPIFGDIRSFISQGYAESYQGMVDIVTGGFPCQPFSVAGKGLGEADPRNMWPSTIEAIRIIRPKYTFLENVPGLINGAYFGTVLGDLAEVGYNTIWGVFSACSVGAPHVRQRLFAFSYSQGNPKQGYTFQQSQRVKFFERKHRRSFGEKIPRINWQESQPGFYQVDDGISEWVGAISGYGNAQVPLHMAYAFSILSQGIVE